MLIFGKTERRDGAEQVPSFAIVYAEIHMRDWASIKEVFFFKSLDEGSILRTSLEQCDLVINMINIKYEI